MTGNSPNRQEITSGTRSIRSTLTITTSHKFEIIPITYSYSFINNDSNEFAVTAGINWNKNHFVADGLEFAQQ